jgi:two-component system, chemotaxis family, sensor kinase Cph1
VLIADPQGRVLFANDAALALHGQPVPVGTELPGLFTRPATVQAALAQLRATPHGWRQELELCTAEGPGLPVAVHAELVTGRDGLLLGHVLTLIDLRESRRADTAREHLEGELQQAAQRSLKEADEVISAILTNASLAAMDIADARGGPPVAPLLTELEASTRRATALYAQIRKFSD